MQFTDGGGPSPDPKPTPEQAQEEAALHAALWKKLDDAEKEAIKAIQHIASLREQTQIALHKAVLSAPGTEGFRQAQGIDSPAITTTTTTTKAFFQTKNGIHSGFALPWQEENEINSITPDHQVFAIIGVFTELVVLMYIHSIDQDAINIALVAASLVPFLLAQIANIKWNEVRTINAQKAARANGIIEHTKEGQRISFQAKIEKLKDQALRIDKWIRDERTFKDRLPETTRKNLTSLSTKNLNSKDFIAMAETLLFEIGIILDVFEGDESEHWAEEIKNAEKAITTLEGPKLEEAQSQCVDTYKNRFSVLLQTTLYIQTLRDGIAEIEGLTQRAKTLEENIATIRDVAINTDIELDDGDLKSEQDEVIQDAKEKLNALKALIEHSTDVNAAKHGEVKTVGEGIPRLIPPQIPTNWVHFLQELEDRKVLEKLTSNAGA
ncbi:hypothetical protein HOD30_02995 [Candidatus Peregrinibacteria bacterium]|jgi:hypothetical protein|nr:hypothetical protein [Candidatus Peregrinibacteria bacterium]MBT4632061.1 hypothetical protein [Candidatus Peregrinibacteria bacterium]MBT5516294.1 hypothetical protein [Candidatus Peregrinibacteria bacterium]MBT5823715.1 hypothetical protein [Candidatus Peregrinibacteria bacterium]